MGLTLGNQVQNSLVAAFYQQRELIIIGLGAISALIH